MRGHDSMMPFRTLSERPVRPAQYEGNEGFFGGIVWTAVVPRHGPKVPRYNRYVERSLPRRHK